jgi:hypothetical protein
MPTPAYAPTATGCATVPLPKRVPGATLAAAQKRYSLASVRRSAFTWFTPRTTRAPSARHALG